MITGYTNNMTFNTNNFNRTTSTSSFIFDQWVAEVTVESFEFKKTSDGNFIEVVKRQKPNLNNTTYLCQEQLDRVWKEIYGVTSEGGRQVLKLIQTIEGKVNPGHYVEESVDFDE